MDWTRFPKQDFLDTLAIGDDVAVRSSFSNNAITKVIEIAEEYIRVEKYPDVWFEPRTGLEIPDSARKRTAYSNRKLFPAAVEQARRDSEKYRANLMDEIRTVDATITLEMYQKCIEAINEKAEYRSSLMDAIETTDTTITLEMYQKCLEAIDQALGQK